MMTIEEKAKAYDEALAIAKQVINNNCSEVEKLCLECVLPELKESNDEKIRKGLVQHLKELRNWKVGTMSPIKVPAHYDAWITYLEKQNDANKEYWRGYREGKQEILDKYAEIEKQKEEKSTLVEKLRSISTPADENWFEIQKRWEKEDEQKPAEWSEDERIRKALIEVFKKKLEKGFEWVEYGIPNRSVLGWLEKQKKQNIYKSSKSEIDFADRYSKDVWEKLMSKFKAVEEYSIGCNDVSDIVLNAILNAFKWQKEQQPAEKSEKPIISEWSEEDERMRSACIAFIQDEKFKGYERSYECVDWLKSLRPSWKPEGQQLDCLRHMINVSTVDKIDKQFVIDLYEQLKKL